jgi:hypothetical protein
MAKFKIGDKVQMEGVPLIVEVLELGDCEDPRCDLDGGTGETFRFVDPETGEDDWMHTASFELVTDVPRPAGAGTVPGRPMKRVDKLRDAIRAELQAEATKEFVDNESAPTWRHAGVATVSLPVSKPRVAVSDQRAYAEWVAKNAPTEVHTVTTVRETYTNALAKRVKVDGDAVCLPDDGQVIPGLAYVSGGRPGSISIKKDAALVAQLDAEAADIVAAMALALTEPSGHETPTT